MSDKPFKTYQELIVKLRDEKKLEIPDENRVITLMKKHSYFSLVSGYKTPFKQPSGEYLIDTTIEDLLALFEFDNHLRDIFFHNILITEKHIKSLLSYAFVERYGDSQKEYLNFNHYSFIGTNDEETYVKCQEVKKLIATFQRIVRPPFEHQYYIKHQWDKHHNIPLWAAIKVITLGSVSKMYSLCDEKMRIDISKEFAQIKEFHLVGMLDVLTRVRNVCAHNERLYDFHIERIRAIQDMPLHQQLGIGKKKGQYKKGKQDLFAAVVCLKYLLEINDFNQMVKSIESEIDMLCRRTQKITKEKILKYMGFPLNWTDCTKY